ncbi:putative bifunctional UDP-N-acetylglucosamine transferase and deubiquitinase ALG13 [Impatiens glandulifera]|uniref:putative bifunctional UDP-N-acetylglucosamine transferase and deubiquitinase ALG13 n=1 Tax=Impatiens glandulifera TaxID=253017 RepID=UPI001FB13266|nr:putative bifunctional UDP-N-acetylglucosamine transferase and deubiquitinase ALG13 [Impatiens glandulifera]
MKVMKAMKKLKFWSRKKKTKKPYFDHNPPPPERQPPPPPPPPPCHCCYSGHLFQPSAPPPPLPPWMEQNQTNQVLLPSDQLGYSDLFHNQAQEIVSYQQYMVHEPVYGVPIEPRNTREKNIGFPSFLINFGKYIFQCFCPCVNNREIH